MKTQIASGLTSVVAATMCSMVLAQNDTAQAVLQAQKKPIALKAGHFQIDVTPSEVGALIDISASEMNPEVLLRAIAEKAGLKVLVSDDVRDVRILVSVNIVRIPLEEAVSLIVSSSTLEMGKIGDTYLVVRSTQRPPILQSKIAQPAPAPVPRFNPGQDQPQPPRNWRAFPFNGDDIYVVPLGPDNKNKAVVEQPEAKEDATSSILK